MRERIGPFRNFAFHADALDRLGRLRRRGRTDEVRCLASACVDIRDQGVDAMQAHEPGLFDVYRCGYVVAISVGGDGHRGTVLDFFPAPDEVP